MLRHITDQSGSIIFSADRLAKDYALPNGHEFGAQPGNHLHDQFEADVQLNYRLATALHHLSIPSTRRQP
jgi:hypothetical protein